MSGGLILIYGILAYLAFFATILYAIGFTNDAVVPQTIVYGGGGSISEALIIDTTFLVLFGIVHSAMARPAFKAQWTKIIPTAAERSTYVLVASLQLAAIFFFWQPIPPMIWAATTTAVKWLLHGVSLAGWVIVFVSTFQIDHFDLFGLRQVWLNFRGQQYTAKPFVVKGLYKFVRHPLMSGFILAFWATPMLSCGHVLFAGVMTAYILIGIFFEERDLVKHLGEEYLQYKKSTPMLIPWKKSN